MPFLTYLYILLASEMSKFLSYGVYDSEMSKFLSYGVYDSYTVIILIIASRMGQGCTRPGLQTW